MVAWGVDGSRRESCEGRFNLRSSEGGGKREVERSDSEVVQSERLGKEFSLTGVCFNSRPGIGKTDFGTESEVPVSRNAFRHGLSWYPLQKRGRVPSG